MRWLGDLLLGRAAQLEDADTADEGHDECAADHRQQHRDTERQREVPEEQAHVHLVEVLQDEDQQDDQDQCAGDQGHPGIARA